MLWCKKFVKRENNFCWSTCIRGNDHAENETAIRVNCANLELVNEFFYLDNIMSCDVAIETVWENGLLLLGQSKECLLFFW